MYKFIGHPGKMYEIQIKLNTNCSDEEKGGQTGPGSCGGVTKKEKGIPVENSDITSQINSKIVRDLSKYPNKFRSPRRESISGKVNISMLSVKDQKILDSTLSRLQSESDRLGIRSIRGVSVEGKSSAGLASMADGILALTTEVYTSPVDVLNMVKERNIASITNNEKSSKLIELYHASEIKNFEKNNPNKTYSGSFMERDWLNSRDYYALKTYKEENAWSKKRLDRIEKEGTNALIYKWKPGEPKNERGFAADDYFPIENRPNVLLDHEFGHHIHQQYGANNSNYDNPPMEKDIQKLWDKANKDKKNPRFSATKYGDSEPQEWFADSYALYKNGREDLVDSRLLKYMKDKKL